MFYDYSKFHRFKKDYIIQVANDPILNTLCKELWVFGSSVNEITKKIHTPRSDIDFGIICGTTDYCDDLHRKIHQRFYELLGKNKILYDLIWMDDLTNKEPILKEIYKGIKIIGYSMEEV